MKCHQCSTTSLNIVIQAITGLTLRRNAPAINTRRLLPSKSTRARPSTRRAFHNSPRSGLFFSRVLREEQKDENSKQNDNVEESKNDSRVNVEERLVNEEAEPDEADEKTVETLEDPALQRLIIPRKSLANGDIKIEDPKLLREQIIKHCGPDKGALQKHVNAQTKRKMSRGKLKVYPFPLSAVIEQAVDKRVRMKEKKVEERREAKAAKRKMTPEALLASWVERERVAREKLEAISQDVGGVEALTTRRPVADPKNSPKTITPEQQKLLAELKRAEINISKEQKKAKVLQRMKRKKKGPFREDIPENWEDDWPEGPISGSELLKSTGQKATYKSTGQKATDDVSSSATKRESSKLGQAGKGWQNQDQNPQTASKRKLELKIRPNNARREEWEVQKKALQTKFQGEEWNPRKKLSPDTLEGIRALNASDPTKYSTPVLAKQFEVSPEAIRRILRSKWQAKASEELLEDRRERWEKRGQRIWDAKVEMGVKPPKKWRDMGVGKAEPGYAPKWKRSGKPSPDHVPWDEDAPEAREERPIATRNERYVSDQLL